MYRLMIALTVLLPPAKLSMSSTGWPVVVSDTAMPTGTGLVDEVEKATPPKAPKPWLPYGWVAALPARYAVVIDPFGMMRLPPCGLRLTFLPARTRSVQLFVLRLYDCSPPPLTVPSWLISMPTPAGANCTPDTRIPLFCARKP